MYWMTGLQTDLKQCNMKSILHADPTIHPFHSKVAISQTL